MSHNVISKKISVAVEIEIIINEDAYSETWRADGEIVKSETASFDEGTYTREDAISDLEIKGNKESLIKFIKDYA